MNWMRSLLCLVAIPTTLWAQSLEVGGFDLRLGVPFEPTLARLAVVYDVQHVEGVRMIGGGKLWLVRRRTEEGGTVAMLGEREGRLAQISRYWWSASETELPPVFVRWLEEAKRLSGVSTCTTTPNLAKSTSSGTIMSGYETRCGRYIIEHGIPTVFNETQLNAHSSLTLTVR